MKMQCLKCQNELEERATSLPAEVKGEAVTVEGMTSLVCPACGYATVRGGDMPEYMRRAADVFRRRHGLLTSDEIRSRRQALNMTQDEFANHLSVGIASIKRWELGQVQEKAMDSLIRVRTSRAEAQENLCQLSGLFRTLTPPKPP